MPDGDLSRSFSLSVLQARRNRFVILESENNTSKPFRNVSSDLFSISCVFMPPIKVLLVPISVPKLELAWIKWLHAVLRWWRNDFAPYSNYTIGFEFKQWSNKMEIVGPSGRTDWRWTPLDKGRTTVWVPNVLCTVQYLLQMCYIYIYIYIYIAKRFSNPRKESTPCEGDGKRK